MKLDAEQLSKQINPLLPKYGVVFVGLFGSRAKEIANEESDYDLLVEFSDKQTHTLLDLVSLKRSLENELHKPVDLVTTKALHPYIKHEVLKTVIPIYDAR